MKRESPRLHLIGEMNNTFEASRKPCLIRLKLHLLTYFSLSPGREGWELSTFPFLPNLCLLSSGEKQGWGEGRRQGRRAAAHAPWNNAKHQGTPGLTRSEQEREDLGKGGCAVGAGALQDGL